MKLREILFPALFLFLACALIVFLHIFVSSKTTPEVNSALESLSEEDIPEFEKSGYDLEPTEELSPVESTGSVSNDPIVKCMLNECGTIEMKSSQCKLSGCCVIGNEYKVMTDQNECNRLQQNYAKNSNSPNNLPSKKDLILENAQLNANYLGRQTCLEQSGLESGRCFDDCMSESNEGSNVCRFASDSLGWTTDKYSECLNENSSIHDQCTDNCLNESERRRNECEQKFPL